MLNPKSFMYTALTFYLFFAWFSVAPQLLLLATGTTGWAGPRDAILHSLTWLLLPALLPRRSWGIVFGALAIAMGVCALMKVGYFLMFQQEMSQSVFVSILESPPEESKEFMQQFFRWWMIPAGIAFCAPAWWAYRRSLRTQTLTNKSRSIYVVLAFALLADPFLSKDHLLEKLDHLASNFSTTEPWATTQSFIEYQKNLREVNNLHANMEKATQGITITSSDTTPEQTYVLVLGESTNRQRLSLYGYSRKTSPRLEEIRNELLVYDNVVANIPYTIESLSSTLTFTEPENFQQAYRDMNLVTLMEKAGFKTFWITNQQTLTQRNTMLTAFAKLTNDSKFLNNNRRQNTSSYDEVVVEPFKQALADSAPRKLIVVHLLGTHFAYKYRYPPQFAAFDNQMPPSPLASDEQRRELYNQFDNAVLYNDHVVRELIDVYRAKNNYGFLLYFVDHGEEVFDVRDFNGRDMSNPTIGMYDVPFIVWPAPRWAAQHDMKALENTVHRPSSLSLFMNGWCTLAAIQYKECNSADSVFSADFVAKPRWVGILKARQSYEALNEHDRKILTEQRATAAQKTTAQR
jgi:heptose-I-phosphate ethanolaminephosphotransferase